MVLLTNQVGIVTRRNRGQTTNFCKSAIAGKLSKKIVVCPLFLGRTVVLNLVLDPFAGCLRLLLVEIDTLAILVLAIEAPGSDVFLQLCPILAALFRTRVGLCLQFLR